MLLPQSFYMHVGLDGCHLNICNNLVGIKRCSNNISMSIGVFIAVCTLRHLAQPVGQLMVPFVPKLPFMKALHGVLTDDMIFPVLTDTHVVPPITNAHMLTREMRRITTDYDGNRMIRDRLCSNKLFIVGRGGDAELLIVEDIINRVKPRARQWPRRHSGIYPETPEALQVFGDTYYEAMRSLSSPDLFAFFTHRSEVENIVLPLTLSKSVGLIQEDSLSPFFFPGDPWSACLRDKTILIIHPFVESIQCQLRRRDLLFPHSPNTLPPFRFKFVKSFQCIGEQPLPHRDWNETMHATMRLVDDVGHFDVALIAAGSYGLPLAVYCKSVKKASAIVLGGSLQILFGIRGMRWDTLYPNGFKYPVYSTNGTVKSMYNSDWIYPLRQDSVINPEKIEHGSPYWGPREMQLENCPV
jgi:hypothetical protein